MNDILQRCRFLTSFTFRILLPSHFRFILIHFLLTHFVYLFIYLFPALLFHGLDGPGK
jgi:hypothetical protein